jgi:phage-related protein
MDGFKMLGAGIINTLLSPVNGVIRLMNNIPGVDIGEIGLDAKGVALAEGGVVTGPTNALVGEGSEAEAVLPLSKLADMLPSGVAIGDAVLNAATAPMRGIMNTIGSIFDQGDIGDAIKNPISGLMDTIGGMFDGNNIIGDILKNPLEGIMDTVSGMFGSNNIGDSLISAATAPMRGIMDVASNLFGNEPDEMSSPEIGGSLLGGIGEVVSGLFGGSEPSSQSPQPQQENTNNAEMVTLLKELIVVVKQGGDVYIDGAKAGRSMALATSRIG